MWVAPQLLPGVVTLRTQRVQGVTGAWGEVVHSHGSPSSQGVSHTACQTVSTYWVVEKDYRCVDVNEWGLVVAVETVQELSVELLESERMKRTAIDELLA